LKHHKTTRTFAELNIKGKLHSG